VELVEDRQPVPLAPHRLPPTTAWSARRAPTAAVMRG
jgi:hypothetical protein